MVPQSQILGNDPKNNIKVGQLGAIPFPALPSLSPLLGWGEEQPWEGFGVTLVIPGMVPQPWSLGQTSHVLLGAPSWD